MRQVPGTLGLRRSSPVPEVQSMEKEVSEKEIRTMKKTLDKFYKTTRWKKLRESILRRDGYMCQLTKRYGKLVEANTVHHIFPREYFPEYQWEPWNLISLSAVAHNTLHDRDTDQLTEEGLELLKRTARRYHVENVDELIARMK